MAREMSFSPMFGSHLPVLMKAISLTHGDVLEMGTGLFSTSYLHWACVPARRLVVSYENEAGIYQKMLMYEHLYHKIYLATNWDDADIERPWDVALIDHSPNIRRQVDILRLAPYCRYIVVHDTSWKQDKHYNYKQGVFPYFKYRYDYNEFKPGCTTVLSNVQDLKGFYVGYPV